MHSKYDATPCFLGLTAPASFYAYCWRYRFAPIAKKTILA